METGLRLAGYGRPTSFFLQTIAGGTNTLIDNTWFGLRFFPPALARSPAPISFPAEKPANTYRIFLFGESAALGDPRPAYGVGRWLEVLLRDRFPGRAIEVVCVAMTAINSHALPPIARACARLDADLWIVYAGHNEMAGPFGANTVFGLQTPPRWVVRASLSAQRLRTGQFLAALLRNRGRASSPPDAWGGLGMFRDRHLPLDHPGRERVYRHFRQNLSDLVRTGIRSRVPILLSTAASNLRDCAPFASSPLPNTGGTSAARFEALCQGGDRLAAAGHWAGAATQFEAALGLHPRSAELHYRLGQSLAALGNTNAAATCFEQARDLDTLPFRADSRINTILGGIARQYADRGVLAVDAADVLGRQNSAGVPGQESFYEHVHLNPEGNYRLARVWADAIVPLLAGTERNRTASWPEFEACARPLGLTDWNRHAALDEMLRRILDAPFTNQLDHAVRLDHFRRQLAGTRARMQARAPSELRSSYEDAIRNRPADHWLHHNYAEYLNNSGDLAQAAAQMGQVRDLIPHHFAAHLHLGRLLARQKQFEEARASLEAALIRRPDLAEAHVELGQIAASQKEFEEALAHFDAAIQRRPESARVYLRRADVLMALRRRGPALDSLREAILVDPAFWEARYHLGIELATDGKVADAQAELAEVVRLRPQHVLARLNLGNLLVRQGRVEEALTQFREVLQLDPGNQTARDSAAALERRPDRENP
ncbi:MAG TPA: tetratricopeptide repeat protein [Verrucomicrobiota bacterium]|nr:tetratricopeptide repeat protein [Verrucomicrobiota bacterium]